MMTEPIKHLGELVNFDPANSVTGSNVGIWIGTRLGPLAQTRFERFYCK
jgi:hypothetical protein